MNKNYTEDSWEKEFDYREQRIWQFAGSHPDFRSHTSEMVKDFIRTTIKKHDAGLSKAIEEARAEERKRVVNYILDGIEVEGESGMTEDGRIDLGVLGDMLNESLALFSPEKKEGN